MISVTDQTGQLMALDQTPARIISLVPSQTELLHTLGLEEKVVGITKFCVHPDYWRSVKKVVGGTKILKFKTIDELNPDLVIANKEENNLQDIERLRSKYPVYTSDVADLPSAMQMIIDVGQLTGTTLQAQNLNEAIATRFNEMKPGKTYSTLYLIWRKPYMAVGAGTFIDAMLRVCGLSNVVITERYPNLKIDDIIALNPELVLFSSEPYPFKEHHMQEIAKTLPNAKLQLVDGEPFSWYGSRMLYSVEYFNKLIGVLG